MTGLLRIFLTLVFLATFAPLNTVAQEATPAPDVQAQNGDLPDYVAWNRLADRVQQALAVGRASDQVFLGLRDNLVEWRRDFLAAKDANDIQINTLRTQIATLGPPPAEGEPEVAILTQRRDELTLLLNKARTPVLTAEEAFSRANVLIGEIDSLFRARQANELISLGPSPVNPGNWPEALRNLGNTFSLAFSGVATSWTTETQKAAFRRDLPLALLLGVVGLVLLIRGRAWVMRIGTGVFKRATGAGRGLFGFLISLGQVVAPLIGITIAIEALNIAGVLDLRGQVIADSLPLLGLCFFGALWLGNRVFGTASTSQAAIDLPATLEPAQGRVSMALLGLVLGLQQVLLRIADYEDYSETTLIVLQFPLVLAAGLLLVRLGRLLRRHTTMHEGGEGGVVNIRSRLIALLGKLLVAVGVIAPLIAAIGYNALAELLIYPSILTLGILSALMVLHVFFVDIFGFITRRDEAAAREALLPILASFAVTLAALPLLALIWGMRVTELTELWTTLGRGFQLGAARITPWTFVTIAVVFAIGFVATRIIQGTLKTTILPKTKIEKGGQNAIVVGLGYVGIFLAALIAITSAGVDLSALAIVAGALSVGIGFGLQNVVSNFVAGIILLVERPISEGDWIEVGGEMGYVRNISVRSTVIETFDRTDVIVPNADLISNQVTNYTRGNLIGRVIVRVGVAYGTDTRKVEKILREVAEAHPLVTIKPSPFIVFQGFGADSLDFEIRAILKDVNFVLGVKSDMNHEIARRFAEENIEIPFAQRDIWLRNPEALNGTTGMPLPPRKPETDANKARSALDAGDMPSGAEVGQGGE